MNTVIISGYKPIGGWIADMPDQRHLRYLDIADPKLLRNPNSNADITEKFPSVTDQEHCQCCTACACIGAYEYELALAGKPSFTPSFLFVYYNQRSLQNSICADSGATIADALYTLNHQGVCSVDSWPENFPEFNQKPHESCYRQALKHRIGSYYQLDRDINQMKACLSEGHPFVFGLSMYQSGVDDQTGDSGVMKIPSKGEAKVFGHALVAVGYDDSKSAFMIRNSWGNNWGNLGYGTIPYDYLLDSTLSRDFWTIRLEALAPAKQA